MNRRLYLLRDGQEFGPLSVEELREQLQQGVCGEDSPARFDDDPNWTTIKEALARTNIAPPGLPKLPPLPVGPQAGLPPPPPTPLEDRSPLPGPCPTAMPPIPPPARGKRLAVKVAFVLVLLGVYIAYPYYSLWSFRNAIRQNDEAKLAPFIDYNALQRSFGAQFYANLRVVTSSYTNADEKVTRLIGDRLIQQMVQCLFNAGGITAIQSASGLNLPEAEIQTRSAVVPLREPLEGRFQPIVRAGLDEKRGATLRLKDVTGGRVTRAFFNSPANFAVVLNNLQIKLDLTLGGGFRLPLELSLSAPSLAADFRLKGFRWILSNLRLPLPAALEVYSPRAPTATDLIGLWRFEKDSDLMLEFEPGIAGTEAGMIWKKSDTSVDQGTLSQLGSGPQALDFHWQYGRESGAGSIEQLRDGSYVVKAGTGGRLLPVESLLAKLDLRITEPELLGLWKSPTRYFWFEAGADHSYTGLCQFIQIPNRDSEPSANYSTPRNPLRQLRQPFSRQPLGEVRRYAGEGAHNMGSLAEIALQGRRVRFNWEWGSRSGRECLIKHPEGAFELITPRPQASSPGTGSRESVAKVSDRFLLSPADLAGSWESPIHAELSFKLENGNVTGGSVAFRPAPKTVLEVTNVAISGRSATYQWRQAQRPDRGTIEKLLDGTLVAILESGQRYSLTPKRPPLLLSLTVLCGGVPPGTNCSVRATSTDENGKSEGTPPFVLKYHQETKVTLTAPPTVAGVVFSGWAGDFQGGTAEITFTLDKDHTLTAVYGPPPLCTLSVKNTISQRDLVCLVTVATNGSPASASRPAPFQLSLGSGTIVELTAPAKVGAWTFIGWSGVDSQTGPTAKATMEGYLVVTADYSPWPGTWNTPEFGDIIVSQEGNSISATYDHGHVKMTGKTTERVLTARWTEGKVASGTMRWNLNADANTFGGYWQQDGNTSTRNFTGRRTDQ